MAPQYITKISLVSKQISPKREVEFECKCDTFTHFYVQPEASYDEASYDEDDAVDHQGGSVMV